MKNYSKCLVVFECICKNCCLKFGLIKKWVIEYLLDVVGKIKLYFLFVYISIVYCIWKDKNNRDDLIMIGINIEL